MNGLVQDSGGFHHSTTRGTPKRLQEKKERTAIQDLERRVQATLNKLTIDNFARVIESLATIEDGFKTEEEMNVLARLLYDKVCPAVDFP